MILSDLEQRNIAIWGLGKEGLSTYRFLRQHFPAKSITLINDKKPDELPQGIHCHFLLEQDIPQQLTQLDVIIKAPGISLYSPLTQRLKDNGITLTSATNIWFTQPRPAKSKIIAITGSNGKSTSCALLAHILTQTGHRTELGGNIGTPLLNMSHDADFYVIELSSYQTADLNHSPDIAVLLNLFPEHIQWHKSHAQYYSDKCQLVTSGANTVILNHSDELTQKFLPHPPKGTIEFNHPHGLHIRGHDIWHGKNKIGDTNRMKLAGGHNRQNLCAVLSVCQALGLDLKTCFEKATTFPGLPHRLEHLGKKKEISFVNDSISTTPEATLAALASFPNQPITLIAGGQDRLQNYTALTRYITEHPEVKVIAAYETGLRMLQDLPRQQAFLVTDLEAAVTLAREITPKGGFILLSPAAPSYDGFKNFEERGDKFRKYAIT